MRVCWMLLVSAGMAILADLPNPSRASELRRMMASPEWKEAVKDGGIRLATFSQDPDNPVTGTAFYCKSREDYVREAEEGPNGYFFCDEYVDYAAACDVQDPDSCNNEFAITAFSNFQRALNVYSCSRYSNIWTCANCTDAYKRWLCTQVYKKSHLPDTKPTETGKVNGGVSPGAYEVTCPFPPPSETDEQKRLETAKEKPHFVKICGGMAKKNDAARTPYSVDELALSPQRACGDDKGGCQGNIFLDPESASTEDDFYVGAIIEITPESTSPAAGQWAEIEAYDGYNRLAMFRLWNKPAGSDTVEIFRPAADDFYKIYLTKRMLGYCRQAKTPKKRAGKACELAHKYQQLKYLPHAYAGGTRCGEDEQCMPTPASSNGSTIFNDDGQHQFPDLGYVCCPKSGPGLVPVGTAESWKVYSLVSSEAGEQQNSTNHSCFVQSGSTRDFAEKSTATMETAATPGVSAIESAGCTFNFTRSNDLALDFCVLRTCFPVCYDVVRRCPSGVEFNCPTYSDRREYDHSVCNIGLAHGCAMVLVSSQVDEDARKANPQNFKCWDLNVEGYGPHPSLVGGATGGLLGLPPGASCVNKTIHVGLVRDEAPNLPTPQGQKEPLNLFWEHDAQSGLRKFAPRGSKDIPVCKAPT